MKRRSAGILLALSLAASSAASDEWVGVRSAHFIVASDAGEKQARQIARQFEQIRGLFVTLFQARVDPVQPVIILAVPDEAGLKELLPRHWAAKGQARPAGLFVRAEDKQFVALRLDVQGPHPYQLVYHEYVHLLNSLNLRRLPLWLNEGLAEFYGSAEIDDEEVRWGQPFPWHVQLLRAKKLLPMDEFLAAGFDSGYLNEADRVSVYYAQCWALTHMLIMGDEKRRTALTDFLKLLDQGVDEPTAVRQALGEPKRLEKDLFFYVSQWGFHGRKATVPTETATVRSWRLTTAEALALKADFMVHTGALLEARPLLDQALQSDANLGLVHEVMGRLLWYQGERTGASRSFARAVQLSPRNYLALYYQAVTTPGETADVVAGREQALRRATEINASFAPALARLAELYLTEDRNLAQALDLAQRASRLEPTQVNHALLLASVLAKMGREDEAKQTEGDARRWARQDFRALSQAVGFFRRTKREPEAESLLRQARDAQPKNQLVAQMLASSLVAQKRPEEAEAVLRDALATNGDSPGLLNSLAYSYAERGVRLDEALVLIDRALAKAPNSAPFLDTRAWTLFRLNRLEEAERTQRRALEQDEDAVLLDHMGDILKRRGATREALECWQKALSFEIDDPEQRTAIENKIKAASPEPAAVVPGAASSLTS